MRNFSTIIMIASLLALACTQRVHRPGKPITRPQSVELPAPLVDPPARASWTYQENPGSVVSPGRGFYSWNTADADKGLTLIRVVLSAYCDREILDKAVTDDLKKRFTDLRLVPGKQAIIRVIYADDGVLNPCGLTEAANPGITIRHLKQLAPILKANRQDIAFFEAGFYGMWGEWNSEYAPSGRGYAEDPDLRFNLVRALLDELPEDFLIMLRRPRFRQELETKVSEPDMRRLAFHNDCFLASATDMGTYDGDRTPDQWKDMIGALSRQGQAIGGETCVDDPVFTSCKAAVQDMKRLGMTYLNTGWNTAVLQRWKDEGCYEEIASHLGYRFILQGASAALTADKNLSLQVTIQNDGFAPAYQLFQPELFLVNAAGESRALEIKAGEHLDPRSWRSEQTDSIHMLADASALAPGNYQVFLRWSYYDRILRFPVQSIWNETWQSYELGSLSIP
ncbi:MAG TPA: DUF4832 domain-containing protein [Oligoflexus sp.]|uniref:DUF4832 domain-containing protein n=1 Tax=Oligoflexus sp. TaxID=1971216 RepID=UPI002D5BC514|nr:DUF4832 domain-containing protein [Oligoflexus sp.]HYX32933.1 DUF4832 domain-containing protein [Oligoflexus sp.]